MDLLQEFYETTLEALKDAKNDRLWFKTNTKVTFAFVPPFEEWVGDLNEVSKYTYLLLKAFDLNNLFLQLGKLYLEREEYGKLQKILRQLHQSCQVTFPVFCLISHYDKNMK